MTYTAKFYRSEVGDIGLPDATFSGIDGDRETADRQTAETLLVHATNSLVPEGNRALKADLVDAGGNTVFQYAVETVTAVKAHMIKGKYPYLTKA